jgi:hypothetical protein
MSFFDFAADVEQEVITSSDEVSRLSAGTRVHRAKFPEAVRKAGFRLLSSGGSFAPGKHDLVIGAAPWSHYDLAALEDLAHSIRSGAVQIYVFDVDDLSLREMTDLLPGFRWFSQTPVVMQYRDGALTYFGQGRDAILWLRQL